MKLTGLQGLLPFVKPYQKQVALSLVLLSLGSSLMLLVPWILKDLIDQFASGKYERLTSSFTLVLAVSVGWSVIVAGRYFIMSWLGERITADLRAAVYRNVIAQPPVFFETLQTGEVLSRLTGDTTLIQTVLGSSMSMGLRSVVQLIGGMVMLAITSFWLFGVNVLILVGLIAPIVFAGRKVRKLSRESQDKLADASALAAERINAASTVQSYARETYEADNFQARVFETFNAAMRRSKMRAFLIGATVSASFIAILFVLWLGTKSVMAGAMTAGQLASFVMYALIAAGAVGVLAEVWSEIQRAAGATERLMELLRKAPPNSTTNDSPIQDLPIQQSQRQQHSKGLTVEINNLSFSYPSRPQTEALSNISLSIAAGETLAIVGPSGSGKSTLLTLLQAFYPAAEHSIQIAGLSISSMEVTQLRRQIAVVTQDPVIFSGSVYDNVRYGNLNATDAEVEAAVQAAAASEFVERLPERYNTFLGERGVRLSGGQRQRIAIARAILKDAPLLLLDEATSALDTESEQLVQQGLEAARQERTTIIVAHRLSTVMKADRVVVMELGRIVEIGSPQELMKQSSEFAAMVQAQTLNS